MKNLIEVLKLAEQFLASKHIARPRFEAELLLAHSLQVKRLDLYMQFDRLMEEKELVAYRALLKRKALYEPVDYIIGSTSFYGCDLIIDKRALIPRPETELLLDYAVKEIEKIPKEGRVAWDLCTGSGCIGLGLKKKFPELSVTLSDLSKEALSLSLENAEKNTLDVQVVQGDLLTPFVGKKADFIFCNPPYISEEEAKTLDPSVIQFEPHMALVAQGKRGESFYQRLAVELPSYLNEGALVFFEMGKDQGDILLSFFEASCWKNKRVVSDLAGHDRFFFALFTVLEH